MTEQPIEQYETDEYADQLDAVFSGPEFFKRAMETEGRLNRAKRENND